MSDFGAYLKQLRESRGMSLRDVETATAGKVSNAYLSQIETNKIKAPSVVILWRLSAALAVDFEVLCKVAVENDALPKGIETCPTCGQMIREDRA